MQIWKQKLWEWNTAWMGLGLGLALTFFFTEGMKNLFGKPRPDLLARCDLDPMAVQSYALGGYGNQLPEWNQLVSWTACRQTDRSMLDDGFMSFPSGHSACRSFAEKSLFLSAILINVQFPGPVCSTWRCISAQSLGSPYRTFYHIATLQTVRFLHTKSQRQKLRKYPCASKPQRLRHGQSYYL